MTSLQLRRRVARNLRRLRLSTGLSQRAAATRAGLNIRHLQRLESGQSAPKITTIAKLAGALWVDPFELIRARKRAR